MSDKTALPVTVTTATMTMETDTSDTPNDASPSPSPSGVVHSHTPLSPPDSGSGTASASGSSVRRTSSRQASTTSRRRTRARGGRPLKINYPKKRVSVACDVCRARKTRCDAQRPACSFCGQLGIACVYRQRTSGGTDNSDDSNNNNTDTNKSLRTPNSGIANESDIVARLGRLESLLQEKESAERLERSLSPLPISADVASPAPLVVPSPGQPGEAAILFQPPTPSPVVPFSAASPYIGHSPEQYHHRTQPYDHHYHNNIHHQYHPPDTRHESFSPYVTTPTDHGLSSSLAARNTTIVANNVAPQLFGYRLDSLSRLGPGATSLPSLHALCHLDVDINAELESELFGSSTSGLLAPSCDNHIDLSPRRCWSLEQAFSRDVLPWCPIIEQHECAALVARAAEDGFPRDRLQTAVALLVLALGSYAKNSGPSRRDHNETPGLDYFHAGQQVIDTAGSGAPARYSILRVQCDLLVTFYFLFSLKPILAYEVLSSAELRLLMLLQLRSTPTTVAPAINTPSSSTSTSQPSVDNDPTYDERLHRAYWTCYLLEHELQAYVSFSARLLQERRDFVPLPLSNYDEPGMYWFLSEIALRGICSSMQGGESGPGTGGVAWNEHMLDAPKLVEEVTLQLLAWHANLAPPVSFPLDPVSSSSGPTNGVPVLRPLLDPHKVFLRAQFYAVQATLRWPFVVQLLTETTKTAASATDPVPMSACVPSADTRAAVAASLHYAVLHVYAVEPLLHDRHLMLFANIAGLFCVTMLLLCAHRLPELMALQLQHPGTEPAVRASLASLRIWQAEPNVQAMVARIEALAQSKGVSIV